MAAPLPPTFNQMTMRFAVCHFLTVVHWNRAFIPTVFEIFGRSTLTNEHRNKHDERTKQQLRRIAIPTGGGNNSEQNVNYRDTLPVAAVRCGKAVQMHCQFIAMHCQLHCLYFRIRNKNYVNDRTMLLPGLV